jgi:HSP20 family protein
LTEQGGNDYGFSSLATFPKMNRVFDNLMTMDGDRLSKTFTPTAEMQETPDAIHLKLEVPGLEVKDIEVQVSAEVVIV